MKKWFLFLISICILCSFVSSPVMAEYVNSEIVCFDEQNGDFTPSVNPRFPSEVSFFSSKLSDEQKAVKLRDFLLERLNNIEVYQDELTLGEDNTGADALYIDLSGLYDVELYYDTTTNKNATKEILRNAINDIRDKSPRTFWCDNYYSWYWNKNDCKLFKLGLRLNCDIDFDVEDGLQPVIDEVNALTAEFDGYVQSIVDLIPDDYSDYEKILFVNDYLCTNYKYDTRYYASKAYITNVYDFFKEGTGVCQAYTLAFMAIMDELEIRCDSVVSEDMKHIWNLVELNGKWYHIDVTWNDPCFKTLENDTFGHAQHKYFLLSAELMQDSEHNHYGFDAESYGYEIGTEFDDIEVNLNQSLKSSFIELNGTWYNTGYNDATRKCGLYAFNSPDISSITNNDLKTPLYDIGKWGYQGSYSYLIKYKDTILFNTPISICIFDGNEVVELYIPERANNEKIYGFDIKDNTIRIQLATNPYKSGMTNAILKTVNLVDLIKLTIGKYDETTKQATIYAPEDTNGILIFASYGANDKLIDCKFTVYSEDTKITKGTNVYTAPNGFNTTGAEKVRIMIWENTSTLKPLCDALEK